MDSITGYPLQDVALLKGIWTAFIVKKHTMLLVALETQTIFLGKTYPELLTLFLGMSAIFSLVSVFCPIFYPMYLQKFYNLLSW